MNISRTIITCFFLLLSTQLFSQKLARKAFPGIQMTPLTEETKSAQGYDEDHGIFIPQVVPSGTFGTMDLSGEMILQEINGQQVSSIDEVFTALQNLRAGDKLKVKIFSEGKANTHSGTAIGKPKETHPNAEIEYGKVVYKDNTLRSLLYLPKGVEKPPVVFYLQGYTCQSIEMPNHVPMKRLLDDWIEAGYAVYMVEKPGLGDSQ